MKKNKVKIVGIKIDTKSDKYKDNPEIGLYKGLTIGDKSDYDRGIIKGDYSFVIQTLADFNQIFN